MLREYRSERIATGEKVLFLTSKTWLFFVTYPKVHNIYLLISRYANRPDKINPADCSNPNSTHMGTEYSGIGCIESTCLTQILLGSGIDLDH